MSALEWFVRNCSEICDPDRLREGVALFEQAVSILENAAEDRRNAESNAACAAAVVQFAREHRTDALPRSLIAAAKIARCAADWNRAVCFAEEAGERSKAEGDERSFGKSQSVLGAICVDLGVPNDALAHYQAAKAAFLTAGDENGVAAAEFNTGLVRFQTGRYRDALAQFAAAKSRYDQSGDLRLSAVCDLNSANVYRETGRRLEALALYRKARKVFAELGDERRVGSCLVNLGNIYFDLERWYESAESYRQAQAVFEKLNEKARSAGCRLNLGTLSIAEGRLDDGLDDLQQAKAVFESVGDSRRIAECELRIAEAESLLGLQPDALRHATNAERLAAEAGDGVLEACALVLLGDLTNEPRESALRYEKAAEKISEIRVELRSAELAVGFGANFRLLPAKIALSCLHAGMIEAGFEGVQKAKGAALRIALGAGTRRVQKMTPEEAASLNRLRAEIEKLDAEIASAERHSLNFVQLKSARDLAAAERNALRGSISLREADEEVCSGTHFSISQILAAINSDTALLEFVCGEQQTAVFVLSEAVHARVIELPRVKLERMVEDAAAALQSRSSKAGKLLEALGELLLRPIEALITGKNRLVICPDGPLHGLPFCALRMKGGAALIETHGVVINASASDYASSLQIANSDAKRTIAVGVSEFAEEDALPNAESEALRVAEMMEGDALLGKEATLGGVLEKLCAFDVAHFATHAKMDDFDPLSSALILTEGERLEGRDLIERHVSTQLVTLSACSSAGGQGSVDGLLGLAWAFMAAGCPNVLGALWRLEDVCAKQFAIKFYERFAAGDSKVESYREACLHLMKSERFADPHFWAGWRLIGAG